MVRRRTVRLGMTERKGGDMKELTSLPYIIVSVCWRWEVQVVCMLGMVWGWGSGDIYILFGEVRWETHSLKRDDFQTLGYAFQQMVSTCLPGRYGALVILVFQFFRSEFESSTISSNSRI